MFIPTHLLAPGLLASVSEWQWDFWEQKVVHSFGKKPQMYITNFPVTERILEQGPPRGRGLISYCFEFGTHVLRTSAQKLPRNWIKAPLSLRTLRASCISGWRLWGPKEETTLQVRTRRSGHWGTCHLLLTRYWRGHITIFLMNVDRNRYSSLVVRCMSGEKCTEQFAGICEKCLIERRQGLLWIGKYKETESLLFVVLWQKM